MKIYFAGSIRGGRDDQGLYLEIINILKKYGQVLTEHIGNKNLLEQGEVHLKDEDIFSRNVSLLNECDAIVAEVTNPSLGIGCEIGRMENQKPILCLFREGNGNKLSAMIAGNRNLQIEKYESLPDIEKILSNFLTKQL